MSISSTNRKAGPFSGNGVTAAFPFAFKVFASADVVVVATDVAGVESTLTLGTNYTIALNSNQDTNPGGTVTMLAAPAAGTKLTITSAVAYLQPVTLTNQGGFYPKVINDALDRSAIQIQQLAEAVERSIKVDLSSNQTASQLLDGVYQSAADAASSAASAAASLSAMVPIGSALSGPNGSAFGFRNKIINGGCQVAQRGTYFATPAADTFIFDRFRVGWTGAAPAAAQQYLSDVPGGSKKWFSLIAGRAGNTALVVSHRIEAVNCFDLSGGSYTISGMVYTSDNRAVTLSLTHPTVSDNFGALSGFQSQALPSAVGWRKFSATFVANALVNNGLQLSLEFGAVGAGINVSFAELQLEAGTVATPFENRPYGLELGLCQRYYYRRSGLGAYGLGQCLTTTGVYADIRFPVDMRVAPGSVEINGVFASSAAGAGIAANSGVITNPTPQGVNISLTMSSASFAPGNAAIFGGSAGGSYIGFPAEL